MTQFYYQDGELNVEQVPISKIAAEIGTPFYCYSASTIERQYKEFCQILAQIPHTICYSIKANSNIAVIHTLAKLGAGADVVSGGELVRALEAGVPPEKIVFSGVGKTSTELTMALERDILQINIESVPELEKLEEVARSLGKRARVAFRINPNVDAGSHDKISTGRQEDKFGIDWTKVNEAFSYALKLEYIEPVGLAMHIGSQLTTMSPFKNAFMRLRDVTTSLMTQGHKILRLDVGGGIAIPYDNTAVPTLAEYSQVVIETIGDLGCEIIFEPGRVIVGNAGVLITKIIYIKEGPTRKVLIVDAAMNDLLRPSLYGAKHEILTISEQIRNENMNMDNLVDIVGPICETGDKFATGVNIPIVKQSDLIAIKSAGAYGAVMSSTYNSRALIPEIIVKNNKFGVARKRINIDTLLKYEKVPDWL